MTAYPWAAMAPYLVALVATLAVVLILSFWRIHRLVAGATVVGLLAVLASLVGAVDAGPQDAGVLYRVDGYAHFFTALFVLVAIVTALNARAWLERGRGDPGEFYVLLSIATLGAMTLAAATHFASLLLGLEILSVALYTMIAYPEEGNPPLEAALKYLVLSGVASTTMLFGMALVYNATGSLAFDAIETALIALDAADRTDAWHATGVALIFIGLAFKLSLVPFHMWTPDVYQGAPTLVAGYLATVSKAAAFAVLLRFALEADVLSAPFAATIVAAVAILSMIIGNLLALLQRDIKRLLAYSSIAHAGYLMIALLAAIVLEESGFGVETALVFLAGYVAMTLAAFVVVAQLGEAPGHVRHDPVAGLFWRRPLLAFVLTVALLSLAGIPLTAGFIAKFYLFAAGVEGGLWALVWAMIVGSAIGIYYYLRVVFAMSSATAGARDEGPTSSLAGTVTALVLGFTIVAIGTFPAPLIDLVRGLP
jgi:NADH-quinone oxidoreductase subunit N